MSLLFLLTLNGTLVSGLVLGMDRLFRHSTTTRFRRIWWVMAVLAFLVRIPIPILPETETKSFGGSAGLNILPSGIQGPSPSLSGGYRLEGFSWDWILMGVWMFGVVLYAGLVLYRTLQTHRFWSYQRLCTDSRLLQLLEDTKAELGVIAPIGVVVSELVPAPAILGWIRPRILLPTALRESLPVSDLRLIIKHELAHFQAGDLAWNWLFFVVTALHWFNPLAHLTQWQWRAFIEESADETTLRLQDGLTTAAYGEVLLKAIRQVSGQTPCGALAIGETLQQLKTRIMMIKNYSQKRSRPWLALAVLVPLLTVMLPFTHAEDSETDVKKAAADAMNTWLAEIDGGDYKKSWTDASEDFQKALTQYKWVAALTGVRTPLGKCENRALQSELHQTEVPSPGGLIKGDFMVAQYKSKFENLAFAVETVCFQKEADGSWKASGYYIKPQM